MKKILLLPLFIVSSLLGNEQSAVPFGFNVASLEARKEKAASIISTAHYKRAAVVTTLLSGAAFYVYRTWYKYIEYAPPGSLYMPVLGDDGKWTTQLQHIDAPWSETWLSLFGKLTKQGCEIAGGLAVSELAHLYFDPFARLYIGPFNNRWFLSKCTDITDLRTSLLEDTVLLPVGDMPLYRAERVAIIKSKLELLMIDLMKFYGYLAYRQEREFEESTLCAVKMQAILNLLSTNTQQFCIDFDRLLNDYAEGDYDLRARAEKRSEVEAAMTHFFDTLYADIKTFDLYEHQDKSKI